MTKKIVQTAKAPNAVGPYSQAIIANGFVYTAGQIPLIPGEGKILEGDIQAQAVSKVGERVKKIDWELVRIQAEEALEKTRKGLHRVKEEAEFYNLQMRERVPVNFLDALTNLADSLCRNSRDLLKW